MACSLKKRKIAAALIIVCMLDERKNERKRKKRSTWVKEWLRRSTDEDTLNFQEMDNQKCLFTNFTWMDNESFKELLKLVSPHIKKKDTNMRKAIPEHERLAVTLRFLAFGDSYKSLSLIFRIAPNTISLFVPEVCIAIYEALKDVYLKVPSTQEEWNEVALKFDKLWNFPNCIGAVDCINVDMVASPITRSPFYNSKSTHGVLLMAVVDAEYNFLYVDVGHNGYVPDGEVFEKSAFQYALEHNDMDMPQPKPLPGLQSNVPFVLVANDTFRMQKYLLTSYPGNGLSVGQRIFNYRLSRARRTVENALGIMVKRFQVLSRPSKLNAERTTSIALACCALHNFLLKKKGEYATPALFDRYDDKGAFIPGAWRNDSPMTAVNRTENTLSSCVSNEANTICEEFEKYFMSQIGELSWQYKYIYNEC